MTMEAIASIDQCAGATGACVCGEGAAPASVASAAAFHEGRGPTALTIRGVVAPEPAGALAGFPCGRTAFGGGTFGVAIGPEAGVAGAIALPCGTVAPPVVVVAVVPAEGATAVGVGVDATGTAGVEGAAATTGATGAAAPVVVVPETGEAGLAATGTTGAGSF